MKVFLKRKNTGYLTLCFVIL